MTVKKLSDSDKHEILDLYRKTGETTSTLAERYGVSNSTISRFLKSTLIEDEYEELIQQKRAARTFGKDVTSHSPLFSEPEPDVTAAEPLVEVELSLEAVESTPVSKRLRRRDSTPSKPKIERPATAEVQLQLLDAQSAIAGSSASPLNEDTGSKPENLPQLLNTQPLKIEAPSPSSINESADRDQGNQPQRLDRPAPVLVSSPRLLDEDSGAQATAVAQMLGEDLIDESEDLTDEDEDDDDDDLEALDDDELDEDRPILTRRVSSDLVQVLPLSEATLPRTCYLVIDRASELITRPLRDFGDLGQIPSQEDQQKTLPVFDNHRIARRFSTKRDRVIKVPDSRLLQKTRSQLQAKGITRLLVDGQVYSLSSN